MLMVGLVNLGMMVLPTTNVVIAVAAAAAAAVVAVAVAVKGVVRVAVAAGNRAPSGYPVRKNLKVTQKALFYHHLKIMMRELESH